MSALVLLPILFQMNFYTYPILMVFGSIGNIFIFIYFYRQRHNPCSIYLMHSAITNLLYILSYGLFSIFYMPYYDDTLNTLLLCKFSIYTPNFLGQVARTILILACMDRYMITSDRAHFRAFSTPKRAKYFILFSYVFWLIAASHTVIFTVINNGQCTRVGIYATFFTFYIILFLGLIPSSILCIFGYLTYRNMKQLRNRVHPVGQGTNNANNPIQRRDRSLLVLVAAEVIFYLITANLFPAILLESMITDYLMPYKSWEYHIIELFVINVAAILLLIYSAAPFYVYMVSSRSFRQDFKKLIINCYQKVIPQVPTESALHRRRTQPTQRTTRV